MPIYSYRAKTIDGQLIEGLLESESKGDVRAILKRQNAYPTEIVEIVEKKDINVGKNAIPMKELYMFCQEFASIIKAGVSYTKALDILRKQADNKVLKKALDKMYDDLQKGLSLSDSMQSMDNAFPEIVINMVRSGETSGSLDKILLQVGNSYEKSYKLKQKIKNAMIYPIIVGAVSLLVCLALVLFVVPTFTEVFSQMEAELPALTRGLIAFSNFIVNYGLYLLIVIILILFIYKMYTRKGERLVNKDKRKVEGKGVIKKLRKQMITSTFCRNLANLLTAGVPYTKSLMIASGVLENAYAERIVLDILDQVRRGKTLGSVVGTDKFFPEMVEYMTVLGEETGNLDETLMKLAYYYDNQVDNTVTKLISTLEPMLIIFVAILIGVMVIAVALPMLQMTSTF